METPEVREARRQAQCAVNREVWKRRHESMMHIPASFFFDMLDAYLVNGERASDCDTFDIAEIIMHLRERFPDDLTTVQVVQEG